MARPKSKYHYQHRNALVSPPTCPYCGAQAHVERASVIYGLKYHNQSVWVCNNFPKCDSYIGCHYRTKMPFGTLANLSTRHARVQAHAAFDPLWRTKKMTRNAAYIALATYLGRRVKDTHIGLFDERECARVIEFTKNYDLSN